MGKEKGEGRGIEKDRGEIDTYSKEKREKKEIIRWETGNGGN